MIPYVEMSGHKALLTRAALGLNDAIVLEIARHAADLDLVDGDISESQSGDAPFSQIGFSQFGKRSPEGDQRLNDTFRIGLIGPNPEIKVAGGAR